MTAEQQAAEMIDAKNVTHYSPLEYRKVISELLRLIAHERREHARELRAVKEELQA